VNNLETNRQPRRAFEQVEQARLAAWRGAEPGLARSRRRWVRQAAKLGRYLAAPRQAFFKLRHWCKTALGLDTTRDVFPDHFIDAYRRKRLEYQRWSRAEHNRLADVAAVEALCARKSYRGILVYPETVPWDPPQRPQQLLREFARAGYLCFFCERPQASLQLREIEENLFAISGEAYLIYPLRQQKVIVLCTWMLNLPLALQLVGSVWWYDLIDQLEIFSLYDAEMQALHERLVPAADLVTCSAANLLSRVAARPDALYLPNGVMVEDFALQRPPAAPDALETQLRNLRQRGQPLIGFYGAIAAWVDQELVADLARQRPGWQFVLLGRPWVDTSALARLDNVHLPGEAPYHRLAVYAANFDVAMIPFCLNPVTDSVSPIKLFEYAALGMPVVATPFHELLQYREQPFLRLADSRVGFLAALEAALAEGRPAVEQAAYAFARQNQWRERVVAVRAALAARGWVEGDSETRE
jgi:glycosyltransferase involved in cell wall biosynthesis